MKPIHRILCAIKDPDAARHTGIVKVIRLAEALGASVELFHALSRPVSLEVNPSPGHTLDDIRRNALEHGRQALERFETIARRRGVRLTSSVAWDYPPHEAVVRRAAQMGADLIVAERHKGSRTRSWLLHLTDWELLRLSPRPVLLLRNGTAYRRPVILAAVDPGHRHAKPAKLDGDIVEQAQQFAGALQGCLEVLHANHPSVFGLGLGQSSIDEASLTLTYEDLRRRSRIEFNDFVEASALDASQAHFVEGDPVDVIAHVARELKAGLVVMGAVSRTGLQRVFIGNTAERVLSALPCDVLVIKPEGFEPHIATEPAGMRLAMPPPFAPMPV